MKEYLNSDTIAAISTALGKSGIGIVRLSGKDALTIADKIFLGSNGKPPSQFASHSLRYGWIINNAKCKMQNAKLRNQLKTKLDIIDEVLLTVMRAPCTYTKEDIVEINCHSGIVVLKRILELVLQCGARLAAPGEFTKRAYLNGRIDLAQAEAVLDIINSQTKDALKLALGQLQGKLSRKIKALRRNLLDILTQLELSVDFSDQGIEPIAQKELLTKTGQVAQTLKEFLDNADKGAMLRQGLTCVILGKPNVGKSSLLNAMLKKDRAIVTPLPGTTRDALEEPYELGGIPLRLVDTAGIIRGGDLVEREAVKRSRKYLDAADLTLLVLDASRGLSAEDLEIYRLIRSKGKPTFIVLNKEDLPAKLTLQKVARVLKGEDLVCLSALRGSGLDILEKKVTDYIWQGKVASCDEITITNIRHKEALRKAQRFLKRAIKSIGQGRSAEIVTIDIKAAQQCLSEIVGAIDCVDVLEHIFSQFCIGK